MMTGISLLQYHIYDGHDRYLWSESANDETTGDAWDLISNHLNENPIALWKKYRSERLIVDDHGIVRAELDCVNVDDLVAKIQFPCFQIMNTKMFDPLLNRGEEYFENIMVDQVKSVLRSYEEGNAPDSPPILELPKQVNYSMTINFQRDHFFKKWIDAECERIGI